MKTGSCGVCDGEEASAGVSVKASTGIGEEARARAVVGEEVHRKTHFIGPPIKIKRMYVIESNH